MKLEKCPKCKSTDIKMIMSSSGWRIYIQCQKCLLKREYRHYKDYKNRIEELKQRAVEDWNTRVSPFVKCSEKLPELGQFVIGFQTEGRYFVGNFIVDDLGNNRLDCGFAQPIIFVWMPIPEFKED